MMLVTQTMRVPADRRLIHSDEVLRDEFMGPMGERAEKIANVIRAALSEFEQLPAMARSDRPVHHCQGL